MPENPRTGPTALAERNAAVARDRAAGDTWPVISARYGLSVRQAARAYEDAIGGSAGRIRSRPEEVADVVLEAHLEAVSRLRGLATTRNTSVAVAAAGRLPGAASSLLDIAEKLGLSPAPGGWRYVRDSGALFRVILEAAERSGVDRDELRRTWERALAPAGPAVVGRMEEAVGADAD